MRAWVQYSHMRYVEYSFRFAEQILNSKLALKTEIQQVLSTLQPDLKQLSRPRFNQILREKFVAHSWEDQPLVFNEPGDASARMDFLKERVGIDV